MADVLFGGAVGNRRFRDMGDGTFAEVVAIGSGGKTIKVAKTRPANDTAYTANDAVGDASAIWEFASAGPAGGLLLLVGADLRFDVSSVASGMAGFRLEFYDAAPDAIADNAAWDLASAGDRTKHLGTVSLPTPTDKGSSITSRADTANMPLQLAAGSTSVFAVLVTEGAYTPTSAAVYNVRINTAAV